MDKATESTVRCWINKQVEKMGVAGFNVYLSKIDFQTSAGRKQAEDIAAKMGVLYCNECGSERMYNSLTESSVCPFCTE